MTSGSYLALRTDNSVVSYDEIEVSRFKKYYFTNGQRIGMRVGGTHSWLLSDQLGNTALTADGNGNETGKVLYRPWGESRYSSGSTPTTYRFTGQREDATIGLYFYSARYYDPVLGRFTQPDTIVPEPGNPQALNRYAYTMNNPLRYTDPTGHAPQKPGDPDDMPGDCATQWCWENRWYREHGYSWTGSGWSLMGADAYFYDEGILNDTMGELGIQFGNLDTTWQMSEMTLVAQGVVALANKIGSFAQLRNLLPYGASFMRATHALFYYLNPTNPAYDPPAHTFPGANIVMFADLLFQGSDDYVRGTAVHEVAHVIDYFNPFASGVYIHQVAPMGTQISNYAVQNNLGLEYWAEMVAVWVYGKRYQDVVPGGRDSLTVNQSSWTEHVLKGWGW